MRMALTVAAGLVLTVPAFGQSTAPSATPTSPASPTTSAALPPASNIRTTSDLMALCNTPTTDPSYPGAIGLCVGYGSGVVDYHLADTYGHRRARKICFTSPPPTRGEARQMFVSWAQSHPQYMDEPAVEGVMRFMITTFPCHR